MGQGQGQGQDQGQGQGQDHLQLQQRAALPHLLMALSLILALTLVLTLALVRNIIIFSQVRVLVLNQPIIVVSSSSSRAGSLGPQWGKMNLGN